MKEGWTYKKLGEIASFSRGLTYSKRDEADSSDNIVLRSNNIDLLSGKMDFSELKFLKSDFSIPDDKRLKKGSLFICMSNGSKAHLGKVAYVDKDFNYAFGGFMGQITPLEFVDGRFLHYALCSPMYKSYIKSLSAGANINNLKYKDLELFRIPVAPLVEQKRIVERLDAAFENIDKLKANAEKQLAEAQTLFQKSLAKAMEPKEGWEEKTLKEIVLTITDGDHQPPPKSNEGIPFITISNINKDSNKIDFEDTFYVPQHYFDGLKTDRIPQEGDVLYTVTGSFGIPVLIDYKKDFCFQRHIALIRPNQKMLFSKYLYYWILSDYAKVQAEDTATGAAQRTVSLNSLRKFRISIPPLAEQQRIVERLDALSENIRKYEEIQRQIISECDALKQALLRKVFE
jgi:type I restriction enzyme S subunit